MRPPRLRPAGRAAVAAVLASLLLPCFPKPGSAHIGNPQDDLYDRGPARIYAYQPPNLFIHNVGLLTLQLTNLGIVGNPYNEDLSAGWRGKEYLGQACILVGARDGIGEAHVSSSIAGTRKLEFRPSLNKVDTIYPSYEGMPGGHRWGFYDPDDDGDGLIDEDFQNGKDDDGDGRIDEDFAAIGQQMFSCEYTDDTPEARGQILDHVPIGVKIRQRSFQWSEPETDEFVGFDYAILNISDRVLQDLYIGILFDADIGPKDVPAYWEDDMAGYTRLSRSVRNPMRNNEFYYDKDGRYHSCMNTAVNATVAYMWDSPDGETSSFGDAPGYLGYMFLGASPEFEDKYLNASLRKNQQPFPVPSLETITWTSSTAPYPDGDPATDEERYDQLSKGTFPQSSRSSVPGDYRITLGASVGSLAPGQEVHFESAIVVGNGLSDMLNNAANAAMVYAGTRLDLDHDPETGKDGMEHCLSVLNPPGQVYWKDNCQDTVLIEIFWHETTCYYVEDDCDPCTGVNGKESLVKWAGFTTPPSPSVNTDPGFSEDRITNPNANVYYESPGQDHRVVLQWDNLAELRPDPYRGVNVFEGYRIYRVDDWVRPSGSVGPSLQDWKILAEFRKHPRDGRGLQSPYSLRPIERKDRDQVRTQTAYGPLYQIGRYEWADTAGIVNGKVYFYAVTAFSVDQRFNPNTGLFEETIVDGLPTAQQKQLVMPSWGPGTGCDDVKVVPNPYRGSADWDIGPSDCDAAGTRIAFRNLPEGWRRLDVYTLAGDLVFSGGPGDSRVIGGCEVASDLRAGGTFYWDLITRSGQNAVAGVYLLVVDTGKETCRKHFVVIR